jgi:hypothetical protein
MADRASARFATGLADPQFVSADRDALLDEAVRAQARFVRINLPWAAVAGRAPADPSDPGDDAYDFRAIDAAITAARAKGLEPLLTITGAPGFAEGPGKPSSAPAGTWKPDATAYGQFARAVAIRYSGRYQGLPGVRYYQAWNEPNLSTYITPQYEGKRSTAPDIYRRLLNSFYEGVKGVDRGNLVITGGTAPYGDPPGGARTRPLTFLRSLLCLRGHKRLRKAAKCPQKAKFDVLAHHPINTTGKPTKPAISRDDASIADFGEVRGILRAARKRHTLGAGRRPQLWATEVWWSSRPPDPRGLRLRKQALYIEQALYLLWRQGAKVAINLQARDPRYQQGAPQVYAGLYFSDGAPKPALTAFRFPFVTDRKSKGALRAWGKAPEGGRVTIQRKRGGRWRAVKRLRVGAGKVFSTKLRLRGKQRLRAVVGGERSLTWREK